MRQRELTRLLKSLGQLTHAQQQKVAVELAAGERQAASVAIIEGRVDVKPNCPHFGSEHVVRNGTRDRPCSTADAIRPVDDKASVIAALGPLLPKDIILCSDGRSGQGPRRGAPSLQPLSAGIRVVAGVYHVQNVNAYDSRLKDWIRRFHGVATRYLDSYLGWFRVIDRMRVTGLNPASLLASAVRI